MANVRLLDQPADFERLGINQNGVEVWEDGRRNTDTRPNNWEWWYSDFIFEDGTTAVAQFFPKAGKKIRESGDYPSINLRIRLPDGTEYKDEITIKANGASFSQERCDVVLGPHFFRGDLYNYHIHVEPTKGYGLDLNLISCSKPYRPGTSYFEFGSSDKYYTWLCVVPKGEVTGTLTYSGKTRDVSGYGYHDHQWGSTNFLQEWNHWLWARQSYDDYSMLVFDMTAAKKHNYVRFPIMFVQDKDGNLVFENKIGVRCELLEEYHDENVSGKNYPKDVRYSFECGDNNAVYRLRWKKILETGGVHTITGVMKMLVKLMGIKLSYTRYLADGELTLTVGGETIERSNELIYEFMFPGESYSGYYMT